MFFTGTLQEGISKALQETKLVVCFVTDNGDESKTWEDEYLKDDTITPSLDKDAVLLRLEAGSQEAGYLAALVPLPKNPTLVIIKNGELKEYISAGTSREQFVRRVSGAFQAQAPAPGQHQAGVITQTGGTAATSSTETSSSPSNPQAPGQVAPAPSGTTPSSGQQQSQPTSRSSTEGREQPDRKQREETEKRRREKGKMKEEEKEEKEEQGQDPEKVKQNDVKKKAAQQLAERQRQAREERARVLKRIADDKAERKARDEARRAERRAASAGENVEGLAATAAATATAAGEPAPSSTTRRQHDQCAIQVRLFDGSTIRTRFPGGATLAEDVRRWVDSARSDGRDPYTFKVILTPLPNRAVDPAAEEGQTLGELGLAPSSTLVLAPAGRRPSSAPAYPRIHAGLNNPLSRLIAAVLAFVGTVLGGVVGALTGSGARGRVANNGGGGDGGGGQASGEQQKEDRAQGQATGRDGAGSSRINGFNNPDDRQRDYQLYNGNSLNFEPRKDEEEKDK